MNDTAELEQDTHASATVESLKDVKNSTASIDSYKGRSTFAINKTSPYPFSFGILKAKLLVKHMLSLIVFVMSDGRSITPSSEVRQAYDQFTKSIDIRL